MKKLRVELRSPHIYLGHEDLYYYEDSVLTRLLYLSTATRYPGQVDRSMINYSVFVDNRGGFENNAVVNISWERPAGK